MSGVYFKGMQMPENCRECRIDGRDCQEWKWFDKWMTQRAPDCHLFAVPDHGRLIDADKLRESVFIGEQCIYSWDEIDNAIDYATTIIPADKEGDNG